MKDNDLGQSNSILKKKDKHFYLEKKNLDNKDYVWMVSLGIHINATIQGFPIPQCK